MCCDLVRVEVTGIDKFQSGQARAGMAGRARSDQITLGHRLIEYSGLT